MSAIGGVFSYQGNVLSESLLDQIRLCLTRYGGDRQSVISHNHIGIVKTLLATTPEDAYDTQPIFDQTSGLLFAFEGRLDNRSELIENLGICPVRAKMLADGALALEAWRAKGVESVKGFLGDFAIACWEKADNSVYLVRDPMGTRPIFWCQTSDLFAFSTTPKALFTIPGMRKKLCESRLHDMLCLFPIRGPQSLFDRVFRVEPGHFVKIGREIKSSRYHEFDLGNKIRFRRDSDYVEAFGEQLSRAVSARLRSSTPISAELSSGFDSSTIVTIASNILGQRGQQLHAYTSVPNKSFKPEVPFGWYADESDGASAVARRHSNIKHHFVRNQGNSPTARLREYVELRDSPPVNLANLNWMTDIAREAYQRGSRVLLGGMYGNMNISYNGEFYLLALLRSGQFRALSKELLAIRASGRKMTGFGLLKQQINEIWPGFLASGKELRDKGMMELLASSPINPAFAKRMSTRDRVLERDLFQRSKGNSRRFRIDVLTRVDVGDFYLAYNATGVERRDVASDTRLTEFCLALPEAQYASGGESRWLLKRLMGQSLPDEILTAKKRGLQSADWHVTADGFVPQMRELLSELLEHRDVGSYLDLETIGRDLDGWPQNGWDSYEFMRKYRSRLLKGLAFGAFIMYASE